MTEWTAAGSRGGVGGRRGKLDEVWKGRETKQEGRRTLRAGKSKAEVEDTEEEDSCGKCGSKVEDDHMGVVCDLCKGWFHGSCANMSGDEYKILMEIDQKVRWYCSGCEVKVDDLQEVNRKLKAEIGGLTQANKEMKTMIKEQNAKIEKLGKEMDMKIRKAVQDSIKEIQKKTDGGEETMKEEVKKMELKMESRIDEELGKARRDIIRQLRTEMEKERKEFDSKITSSREEMKKLQEQDLEKEMKEIETEIVSRGIEEIRRQTEKEEKAMANVQERLDEMDRGKRRLNMVIFGLPESGKEAPRERYQEDGEMCAAVFKEGLEIEEVEVKDMIRLGKREGGKTRPLLVKLVKEEQRTEILKRTGKLSMKPQYKKVYIKRDMTQTERERERRLKLEIKERKEREEGRFVIRRGKVYKIDEEDPVSVGERTGARPKTGENFQ